MDELLQRLQATTKKAAKLERQIIWLKEDQEHLTEEVERLKAELFEKNRAFVELEERYEAVSLAKSLGSDHEEDRQAVHSKIDLYLKEIDICLKSLGE